MDWTNQGQWKKNAKAPRVADKVDMLDLSDGKWHTVRMIGKTITRVGHWISTRSEDKKKKGKYNINNFWKPCLGPFIAEDGTTQVDASKCPYCSNLELNYSQEAFVNVIDRHLQENPPRKIKPPTRYEKQERKLNGMKAFFKESKESGSYTPLVIARITTSAGKKISEIAGLNTVKLSEGGRKAFGPEHTKYGFDLLLKYDKDADSPNDMYSVQKGERTKLTQEELDYLRWFVDVSPSETEAEALKESKRIKPFLCDRDGTLVFESADEEKSARKSKKKGGKFKDRFDEDDEDDVEDDEDEDDGDSKSKKSSKKSKRSRDEDDDEDDEFDEGVDDDDDDDDDEDDRPRKSKKSSKKSSKKKRQQEDDEDEEDDDEDDRTSRKSKSAKKSSRSRDEDEDDEDEDVEDDEDEDEDDRPRKKKNKKSKSSSKSKRSRHDEDDDEDSDYEDDDEIPF